MISRFYKCDFWNPGKILDRHRCSEKISSKKPSNFFRKSFGRKFLVEKIFDRKTRFWNFGILDISKFRDFYFFENVEIFLFFLKMLIFLIFFIWDTQALVYVSRTSVFGAKTSGASWVTPAMAPPTNAVMRRYDQFDCGFNLLSWKHLAQASGTVSWLT